MGALSNKNSLDLLGIFICVLQTVSVINSQNARMDMDKYK
jgi:hypothetical protein